jgi:NDP-sugar pyrophosphorylase family protein
MKAMQAVVLAGGLGTRLQPVVNDRPKPMAPIGDRPFLEYLLLQLKKHGFDDVVICTAHRGDMIRQHFGGGDRWGLRLRYTHEPELLGTAGAIKLASSIIGNHPFLAMNGDSFFDIDLRALIQHHERRAASATLALAEVDRAGRYGTVEIDGRGTISAFREKDPRATTGLINAGIYVFSPCVVPLIPADRAVSLEREIFPRLIGEGFFGQAYRAWFVDIGVPEDYRLLRDDASTLLTAVT